MKNKVMMFVSCPSLQATSCDLQIFLHLGLQGNDLELRPRVRFFKLLQEGMYFG